MEGKWSLGYFDSGFVRQPIDRRKGSEKLSTLPKIMANELLQRMRFTDSSSMTLSTVTCGIPELKNSLGVCLLGIHDRAPMIIFRESVKWRHSTHKQSYQSF